MFSLPDNWTDTQSVGDVMLFPPSSEADGVRMFLPRTFLSVLILTALVLTGCGSSRTSSVLSIAGANGTVLGGSQPISNATIELYSVGTKGDDTVATPLLTRTVTTDSKGKFSLEGLYSCANATDVYLIATGGDPTPGTSNGNIALMTALGSCGSLNRQAPILINEPTTVAAVSALAPYMTSYNTVGAGTDDAASLSNSFKLASQFVNPDTGTSPGVNVPTGYTVPTATINMLADLVSACVNSGGGNAGDGSSCGNLFSLTTTPNGQVPTNTISALLYLAKNPGLNTNSLYQMAPLKGPFEPQLSTLPINFVVALAPAAVPPTEPTAQSLVLSPTSIAFPSTAIGSSSGVQSATLMNTGNDPVLISTIQTGGLGSSDFTETSTCPATLIANSSCTITVTFSPQNSVKPNATLMVNDAQVSLALSGSISNTSSLQEWPSAVLTAKPSMYLNFNDKTSSFLDQISGQVVSGEGGPVTTQLAGFDNTRPNNNSAGFSWNSYGAASNDSLGYLEWNVPWTMMIHIDRLDWNRKGALILASKGDLGGCAGVVLCVSPGSDSWWQLFIAMTPGWPASQLCFMRNGSGKALAQQAVCTGGMPNWFEAMPNGFNYNIVVEDSGTGSPYALSMYINGLLVGDTNNWVNHAEIPGFTRSNTYATGFGSVGVSVSGGTGYANTTAYSSTVGDPNCMVTGTMYATNGVPFAAYSSNGDSDSGCASAPSIALTSPTGSGVVIKVTSIPISMNSQTRPLMVPGYVSNGVAYGVAGNNDSAPPVNLDELAIFPGDLSFKQITTLFYETKFYQNEVYHGLTANPPLVILEGWGCGPDSSGDQTVAMTIGAAKAGLITLIGAIDDDSDADGTNSVGWWRQMLDEAGFENVPLSVGPNSWGANVGGCPASNITAYDPSTPQNASSYQSSITMLRALYAEYSTRPIYMLMTQAANGYEAFVMSPPDSISPLTGLQLQAQNAANGAWMNMFEGNLATTWDDYGIIFDHNGKLPIYVIGGTPEQGGPGIFESRPATDPLYMASIAQNQDLISGWTNQNVAQVLTPLFSGGVIISYSGGAGYADSTPFTSTGGGPDCQVTGIMRSIGGVPSSIETFWGQLFSPTSTYSGIGYGCTTTPTVVLTTPTGTGVTLIASPTIAANNYGTPGRNSIYSVWPNVYANPISPGGIAPTFEWFQNSLIDPPVN